MAAGTNIERGMNWQDGLKQALIDAGTDGLGQREILKKLENVAVVDMILPELEVLLAQQKVQKFIVKTKGRPKTVWRATVHILKD